MDARPTSASQRAAPRLTPTPAFGPNPGSLRMWSYVPAGLRSAVPLVVLLHGCAQSAQGFAGGAGWLTLAERWGFAVLAPEQSRTNNPARCFNWFEPADIARGKGEAGSIRSMVARMLDAHRLDRRRIFITGLSAGGCMTLALLAAYPELFAAGAAIAAAPFGAAASLQEAMLALMRPARPDGPELADRVRAASGHVGRWPRVAVWQGMADRTVAPANAEAVLAQWLGVHGLAGPPTRTERLGPLRRSVWNDLAGDPVVELDLIDGLGHGLALATGGPEGLGRAGPFLLEAGVSSTVEIARFFGINPESTFASPSGRRPGRLASMLKRLARWARP